MRDPLEEMMDPMPPGWIPPDTERVDLPVHKGLGPTMVALIMLAGLLLVALAGAGGVALLRMAARAIGAE